MKFLFVMSIYFLIFIQLAVAQTVPSDETRRRMNEEIARKTATKEAGFLKEIKESDEFPSSLTINGQTYNVGNNVNEMGQALYASIMSKQWNDVRRFLKVYLLLKGHDPMLVLYARGGLARKAGNYSGAEKFYLDLIALQKDFLPGRLEYARVLFENHQDHDAMKMFMETRNILPKGDKRAGAVRRTIDSFMGALAQRKSWQGYFAIGPTYSSNLNQSSASYTCLLLGNNGTCLFDRKVPDPIQAGGLNFEGTLNRHFPIGGHHGIKVKAQVFGDVYYAQKRYNQATLITQLGYEYQTAHNSFSVFLSHDIGTFGSDILYNAPGIQAQWTHNVSHSLSLKLELNHKNLKYRQASYKSQDGRMTTLYLTGWYAMREGWTIFGGGDLADKTADNSVNAYRQFGLRLGVHKSFGSDYSLMMSAYFQRQKYRAYSELFAARRRDKMQNYTAILKVPILKFAGLTPSLMLQHYRVKSNIDWLYSHHKNVVSLKLEGRF